MKISAVEFYDGIPFGCSTWIFHRTLWSESAALFSIASDERTGKIHEFLDNDRDWPSAEPGFPRRFIFREFVSTRNTSPRGTKDSSEFDPGDGLLKFAETEIRWNATARTDLSCRDWAQSFPWTVLSVSGSVFDVSARAETPDSVGAGCAMMIARIYGVTRRIKILIHRKRRARRGQARPIYLDSTTTIRLIKYSRSGRREATRTFACYRASTKTPSTPFEMY